MMRSYRANTMHVPLDGGVDDRWPAAYGNYERQTKCRPAPISDTQPSLLLGNQW